MRLDELLAIADTRADILDRIPVVELCHLRRVCRAFAFGGSHGAGYACEALGRRTQVFRFTLVI